MNFDDSYQPAYISLDVSMLSHFDACIRGSPSAWQSLPSPLISPKDIKYFVDSEINIFLKSFVNYSWHSIYISIFILYSTAVRHLFHLRSKCTAHLAPNRVITKLLAIFPVLYFTSPWLFYTYQFVVFTTFAFFTQPPNLPPICQPSVCSLYLSLLLFVCSLILFHV